MRLRNATLSSLLLLIGFVLVGPLLVLWTAGYRWNPRNQRFEATGVVVVDTVPTGAHISVGETETALTTPARLTGVFPRDYTLTLFRNGYISWQQTLTVVGGKTTFIDNIRLFPKKTPTLLFEKPATKIALSHDDALLAAAVPGDGFTEIWMIGATSGAATLEARLASSTVETLSWSPSGNTLLVEERLPTGIRATLMQVEKKISLKIPVGILQRVAWSQDDPTKLLGMSRLPAHGAAPEKQRFWIFPANGGTPTPLEQRGATTDNTLPLLHDGLLYGTHQIGTTTRLYAFSPATGMQTTMAVLSGGPYELLPSPERFFTARNNARGVIRIGELQSAAAPASIAAFSAIWSEDTPPAALAWDDVELHLIDTNERVATLARVAEGIRGAAWMADANHAILLTAGDVRAIERAEHFGKHITTVLALFEKTVGLAVGADAAFVAGVRDGKAGIYRIELQ